MIYMFMDIYKEMRRILQEKEIDSNGFGEDIFDSSVFKALSDPSICNRKGGSFDERFRDIISDPNNLFIKRVPDAGKSSDGKIILHNGIQVYDECYYGNFTEILKINKGVHEPSEERMFSKVLEFIESGSTMVELGSYWAFYSLWFKTRIEDANCYCIEPDPVFRKSGEDNFKLNGLTASFHEMEIGIKSNLYSFFVENGIEEIGILHSDIQGAEIDMLRQISPMLDRKAIKYIFVSTHEDWIHRECISILSNSGYRIVCDCDYGSETFQYDGFILACPDEIVEIEYTEIGNRSISTLVSKEYFDEILKFFRY